MILTKNYDYIEDKGDHYLVASLIINDDLEIDLDKRLHVSSHVYVAGGMSASVIVADGNIVVHGKVVAEELQASKIVLLDQASVKNSVLAKESIQIGKGAIGGSVVSSGKIHFLGNTAIKGDISAKDVIVAKSGLSVEGNIASGSLLDVSGILLCSGEVKVLGSTSKTYGRLNGDNYTIIVMDNMMFMVKSSTVTHAIDSIDEYEKEVGGIKEIKIGSKEFEFNKRKDWIRNIANNIRRVEDA